MIKLLLLTTCIIFSCHASDGIDDISGEQTIPNTSAFDVSAVNHLNMANSLNRTETKNKTLPAKINHRTDSDDDSYGSVSAYSAPNSPIPTTYFELTAENITELATKTLIETPHNSSPVTILESESTIATPTQRPNNPSPVT